MKYRNDNRRGNCRFHRKPFHLHKRRPLESDTSWGRHSVELIEARRAATYGRDKCYEVIYVTWTQRPKWREPWHKIVIQTPSLSEARRVFEACVDDDTTGYPLKTDQNF